MAETARWEPGTPVVRREVLANGEAWAAIGVVIVEDEPDLLISWIPDRAAMGYPPGRTDHPWHPRTTWLGHGVLMLQRPGESYAVWHFWTGPHREFACWYINLQEPARRTTIGYDTQDHELDIVIDPDGSWRLKDDDLLEQRIAEGRYSAELVREIRAEGARITAGIEAGRTWWDPRWASWEPDPMWMATPLPPGWWDQGMASIASS